MRTVSIIFTALIIALLVWHASSVFKASWAKPLNPSLYKHAFWVTGVVQGLPSLKAYHKKRFLFATTQGKLLLDWYGSSPSIQPKDQWRLLIKLKPIAYYNNLGEFDYGEFLQRQGVIAKGYVLPKYFYHKLGRIDAGQRIDYWRFKVRARLLRATYGMANQAVIVALVFGDKSGLSLKEWQVLVKSGTSYFVVISGLHIALLAGFIYKLVRWLWPIIPGLALKVPAQKAAIVMGLLFASMYSLLAGFTVPTQRACLTIVIIGIARLYERHITSFQAWAVAFCLVVMWDPLSIYEAGFWLSFIAVWFLLFCSSSRIGKRSLFHGWIYPQWVIFWGILPVSVYCFNQISLVSLITNIIAIPLMVFLIIPGAVFGTLLIFITPGLGNIMLHFTSYLISGLWWILSYFANQTWWGVYLPQPNLACVIIASIAAAWMLAPKTVPGRYVAIILLLPLMYGLHVPFKANSSNWHRLNVPNGEVSIYIKGPQVIVKQINTSNRYAEQVAKNIIVPYLHARGVNKVDCWWLVSAKHLNTKVFSQQISSVNLKVLWLSDLRSLPQACMLAE